MKSIDEKIFQLLLEEELINEKGQIIDENFVEEIKYLVEGKLRDAQQDIKGAMKPLLKHLLLLKYYKKGDKWLYKKKWKKEAKTHLKRIKAKNCVKRKCIEEVISNNFIYERKKVYVPKEMLDKWCDQKIIGQITDIMIRYDIDISTEIQLIDINNFKFYENDESVINSL